MFRRLGYEFRAPFPSKEDAHRPRVPAHSLQISEENVKAALRTATILFLTSLAVCAQTSQAQATGTEREGGTSTDLFVMFGSDFVRPGLYPKANYNIGIGHTFGFLKKDPFGDEVTVAYTYENAGSHGFLHTSFGSHTESLGIMKNFGLPRIKRVTGYTWIQGGLTSLTGNTAVANRLYDGESLGAIIHCNDHNSFWVQETYNKIVTLPWYTTASAGYTWSW
jgi:hypothetical protein